MLRISIFLLFSGLCLIAKSPTDIDLIFSHKLHTQEVGVECADCHEMVMQSTQPSDILSPQMETCYICHDEDETPCSYCHKDAETADTYSTVLYVAKFPHARHVENLECKHCHAGVSASESVITQHMPSMMSCQTGCHDNLHQTDYCMVCHDTGDDLVPADHNLTWMEAHGLVTHAKEEECQSCHVEQECLDCHSGDNLNHQVHPLNFVNSHAIAARTKKTNCYSCHDARAFCSTCHREQLVLPRSHNTAGWAHPSTGGRHAREARMDLDNCIVCHDEHAGEPICAKCHGSKN